MFTLKKSLKKIWRFIWYDDSLISWIVNIILAFVLVKFLLYPGLGLVLGGTTHPVVAVVSGSMHHSCNFDEWWKAKGGWYADHDIEKDEFSNFPMRNGFNKGDIIVLKKSDYLNIGDIIVFEGNSNNPIIHRIVRNWNDNSMDYYQTKGDNNPNSSSALGEDEINEDDVIGKAVFKVPYLGYVKIIFSEIFGGILK